MARTVFLGNVPLIDNGQVNFTLREKGLEPGSVDRLDLTVTVALQSTAGAFILVADTGPAMAAEGVDDLDRFGNAFFQRLSWQPKPGYTAFDLIPAELRTMLGFAQRFDLLDTASFVGTVPAFPASLVVNLVIPIPVALVNLFQDGDSFAQGSRFLRDAVLVVKNGLVTAGDNIVLSTGTARIISAAATVNAVYGEGTEGDVGPLWKVEKKLANPNPVELNEGVHVGVFHTAPVAVSAVTAWEMKQALNGDYSAINPLALGNNYEAERVFPGGAFISARCTPLSYVGPRKAWSDIRLGLRPPKLRAIGITTIDVYDFQIEPTSPGDVAKVALQMGLGGESQSAPVTPRSLPVGYPVPADVAPWLKMRILPGAVDARGFTKHDTPGAAAQDQASKIQTGQTGLRPGFARR